MGWFSKTKSKELADAQSLLADVEKRHAAVDAGVRDLLPLVQQRLEADRALAEAEAGGDDAAINAAAQRLEEARKTLIDAGAKVERQRAALARMADGIIAQHDALRAWLPQHEAAVVEAFTREWNDAIAAFSRVLGKRRAIEQALHRTLDLPDPQPAPVEVEADVAAPRRALDDLRGWVSRLAGWAEWAVPPAISVPGAEMFDPDPAAVYILARADSNIAAGVPVVAACLPAGRLRRLVAIAEARGYIDPQLVEARQRARKAARRMASEDVDDRLRREAEEQKRRYREWLDNTPEGRREKQRQEAERAEAEQREADLRERGYDLRRPWVESERDPDETKRLAERGAGDKLHGLPVPTPEEVFSSGAAAPPTSARSSA